MYAPGVTSAEYEIIIHFPTKGQVAITPATEVTGPNILNSVELGINLSGSNQNPVGVISANTLSLNIDSLDLSLDPTNVDSPYYGEMNTRAWVTYKLIDQGELINMGTYFVNTWVPNISNSTPNNITIQLTDLVSIISKMPVPRVEPSALLTLKGYIIAVIDKLNQSNPEQYQIKYNPDNIKFGDIVDFYYEQLNTSNMGNMLNTISQCTYTNITIDQDGYFITDNLLDEATQDVVMNISGDLYTFSATLSPSSWISYDGIKVMYIPRKLNSNHQLASVSTQTLNPGENVIDAINLGGHANTIDQIIIDTDDASEASVYISELSYDKDYASMTIQYEGLSPVESTITIIGKAAATDTQIFVQDAEGSILTCNVPILHKTDLGRFTSGMRTFLRNKQKAIKLEGWYNPRLRLGDLVHVTLSGDLNVNGYYKITGLDLRQGYNGITYSVSLDPAIMGG